MMRKLGENVLPAVREHYRDRPSSGNTKELHVLVCGSAMSIPVCIKDSKKRAMTMVAIGGQENVSREVEERGGSTRSLWETYRSVKLHLSC